MRVCARVIYARARARAYSLVHYYLQLTKLFYESSLFYFYLHNLRYKLFGWLCPYAEGGYRLFPPS